MNTDTRKIEYFLEVSAEKNFTRAAQNLFITQPTLSQQISSLENELGVTLFDRTNKKDVRLTENGQLFFDLFKRYKSDLNKTLEIAHGNNAESDRKIRIGIIEGLDIYKKIAPFLHDFQEQHAGVNISFGSEEPIELVPKLKDNLYDAIIQFGFHLTAPDNALNRALISNCNNNIVCSKHNPIFKINSPEIRDLGTQRYFAPDHPFLRELINKEVAFLKENGATPEVVFVANYDTVMTYVSEENGYMMTHPWDRNCQIQEYAVMPVDMKNPIYLVWKKAPVKPLTKQFLQQFIAWSKRNQEFLNH